MKDKQKTIFPKHRTCVVCSMAFERGDERLMTVYPTIYLISAPARAMNVGKGICVCQSCFAVALATPAASGGRTVALAIFQSLTANYKKITTPLETPLPTENELSEGASA